MEVALRRRLSGVADVSISQGQQTAAVTFTAGTHAFSAEEFRAAVAEADVQVVTLDVDVCGVIDRDNMLRVSAESDGTRVRLLGDGPPPGSAVCVTGRLTALAEPYELEVSQLHPNRSPR
jgi:L-alanine-DL-glutamate epimerase-like enolase superfamily enzyme